MPTPKASVTSHEGAITHLLMVVHKIHNHESPQLLHVILDSGGAKTMIHRIDLPNGVNKMRLDKKMRMTTVSGVYESGGEVLLQNIRLPELYKNRTVSNKTSLVFDTDCSYDVILGS